REAAGEHDISDGLDETIAVFPAHHRDLVHRRMRGQRRFHFDGRDVDASHLEHVVRPAGVHVVAVGVDAESISRVGPLTLEGRAAARVLIPVEFRAGGAADQQIAGVARRYGIAALIDDPGLETRHRLPQGAVTNAARPVGNEYVQHLRRADAVDDVHAGALAPPPRDVLG